ncbi:MAG: nucleotide sugar dehydrogenase [Proteobacteria bacterium]|nr:nucleotide sugar dehydrogenase [Pseudomonadota bacterium]
MDNVNFLLSRIQNKSASIGIAGLGYVGLPLAVEFAKAGFRVSGVDLSPERIEMLKNGQSYVLDVSSEEIGRVIRNGTFTISTSYGSLKEADVIIICVPTPLRKTKEPDITYIRGAVAEIKKIIHFPILLILESTTYPGTTRELIVGEIERNDCQVGREFFVAFSPERVDPGNQIFQTKNIPKVVGGITSQCTELARALYDHVIEKVIPVKSAEEAEMVKLLENTFRSVNIALVNEMAMMCDRMGIDIWHVLEGAASKPFGFMPFFPGPGIGGHCIPLDPVYLSWKAKTYNFYNRFIELATDINGNMPHFVMGKLTRALNQQKKPLNGSRILLLGMSYKNDIDDIRESPGVEIYKLLRQEKSLVDYHDPYVSCIKGLEEAEDTVYSKELTKECLKSYDCVLLTVAHQRFDYPFIAEHARLIFDTRNAFKDIQSDKIIKL